MMISLYFAYNIAVNVTMRCFQKFTEIHKMIHIFFTKKLLSFRSVSLHTNQSESGISLDCTGSGSTNLFNQTKTNIVSLTKSKTKSCAVE